MTADAAPAPTLRRLATPAALALADLAATFDDLQTVLRCCERLLQELPVDTAPADALALEAFWTTALLSYARCFDPGPRGTGLTEDDLATTGLQGDLVAWHRAVMRMRDHYAAASGNPREQFSVAAAQGRQGGAEGVAVTSLPQPVVDAVTVRQTGALAFALSRVVDERLAAQQDVVFTTLRTMSPDDLARLPVLDVAVPLSGDGDESQSG